MNIKTEITLSEHHLRLAEKMVEEGAFPSISSLVEAAIEHVDQIRHHHEAPADAVFGMADEIRRRMELPEDQWIPLKGDTLFDDVRALIRKKMDKRQNDV
ncbi:hypothetical protein RHSP_02737 [Rhizobium freirei PRF 81]|uniref:Type II toxin-antitoxin system ParD family antitoxin n=1 Tax=Rhizobium freirei PRF 81 TaxID=363754 RepID=N6VD80_9HYPH|nr:hypothetical protein [Rhizobium freirei]ENN89002.1 hypothetical protein RHSP_02737 [Rhizobium freirei PRF 81]